MLQQVFRDCFSILLNLLFKIRDAGRVCLLCYDPQAALQEKIPLLKNWV